MLTNEQERYLRSAERVYRLLLKVYPRRFRDEYGAEMVRLFRDQCREAFERDGGFGLCKFWAGLAGDLARSVVVEHVMGGEERNDSMKQLRWAERYTPSRAFVIGFAAVMAVAVAATLAWPKTYESRLRMKVDPGARRAPFVQSIEVTDPYLLQTEFELIQSREVLGRVVDSLKLNEKWANRYGGQAPQKPQEEGERAERVRRELQLRRKTPLKPQEAVEQLKRMLDIRSVPKTRLIDVRVSSEDPWEAVILANAIGEQFRDLRLSKAQELGMTGIERLQQELADLTQNTGNMQRDLDSLRERFNITEIGSSEGQILFLNLDSVKRLEAQRTDAQIEQIKIEAQVRRLSGVSSAERRKLIPALSPDPRLIERLQELDKVEQSIAALSKEVSEEHPEYRRLVALRSRINQQIDELLSDVLEGMEGRRAVLEATQASFDQEIARMKQQNQKRQQDYSAYLVAKRDLDARQQMRTALMMKINQEQIDLGIPRETAVEILDRAELPLRPIRPNIPLNLALGAVAGLVAGLGLAFLVFVARRSQSGPAPMGA